MLFTGCQLHCGIQTLNELVSNLLVHVFLAVVSINEVY